MTLESSRQLTLQAHDARNAAYLRAREDEKIRRQKDALRKIAPGFEPSAGTLIPTKLRNPAGGFSSSSGPPSASSVPAASPTQPRDVMDDLVDQLVALDSAKLKP